MSVFVPEEVKLSEKHEEILGRRAELLGEMVSCREQLKILWKQQVKETEAAQRRNATLLQNLQKIEDRLREKKMPYPYLLALETQYWVAVEESIPAWEHFLLGKGPHPTDTPGQPGRRAKQKPSTAKGHYMLPPPKPRTA